MNAIKMISGLLSVVMLLSGCASVSDPSNGASGPKLESDYKLSAEEQQIRVGVEFTSMGDFVALVNPRRWKSPLATGGSLSWVNPKAWSEDAGRTGRILTGEVVVVGVAVAAVAGGGGDGDDGGGSTDPASPSGSGGGTPPGGTPPPPVP